MGANSEILTALRWACGTANIIGLGIFFMSLFVNDYNRDYILTIIGLTILISASAIFLIGILFVATEEMVLNTEKGERKVPFSPKVIQLNKAAAYAKRKRRASN